MHFSMVDALAVGHHHLSVVCHPDNCHLNLEKYEKKGRILKYYGCMSFIPHMANHMWIENGICFSFENIAIFRKINFNFWTKWIIK